jgi:tRNA(Arg) A34 adenosine deaminase TadA
MITDLTIRLPDWFQDRAALSRTIPVMDDRMAFVISLARENVAHRTGGPFAAALFDFSGNLISAGVNVVETTNCSICHAEMLAIALAQKAVGRYDLSDGNRLEYELVSSTEPCAMCFGAVPWSGVRRLVCGARDQDARAIGFDEGPKMQEWQHALEQRGITVVRDVLRREAAGVLQDYLAAGGTIYNAGSVAKEERRPRRS